MTRRLLRSGLLLALGVLPMVACDGETESDGSHVVLQDSFSTSGALIVSEDAEGNLGMVLRGRIGVDDQAIVQRVTTAASLDDAYKMLHPGTTVVPESVHTISNRLLAQKAARLAETPAAALARQPAAELPKDSNSFYNSACQIVGGGFSGYSPKYCSYQYGWHSICTYNTINPNDRSYAWNESPTAGYQSMNNMSWKPAIPAWTWQYTQWGGSYSNRYACVTLNGSASGNLGVTHHQYFTDEHNIGVGPD
jgi:hypothetical protein